MNFIPNFFQPGMNQSDSMFFDSIDMYNVKHVGINPYSLKKASANLVEPLVTIMNGLFSFFKVSRKKFVLFIKRATEINLFVLTVVSKVLKTITFNLLVITIKLLYPTIWFSKGFLYC